jgi:hypothetical protein
MTSSDRLPDPRKLDSRLRALLRFPLEEFHRLKREEGQAYRDQRREIEALRVDAIAAKGDQRRELAIEIERRLLRRPIPFTFGVYFPEDDPEDVARVTHLTGPFASVTIRSTASAHDLAALGVHVRNRARDIFTAYVPLELVSQLQLSPAIDYVELARPWRPQLDHAIPQSQIDTLHVGPPAITGKGVIVGVVEFGALDFYHPAFRKLSDTLGEGGLGSTRVLYLWDQTLTPDGSKGESSPPTENSVPPLPGFGPVGGPTGPGSYGTEYGQSVIDKELQDGPPHYQTVRSQPAGSSFHGTLVTSCGAGSARTGFPFGGAAPEADIIYVRTTNGNNYVFADSTNILDGIAYIFARASEANKPCVVNLSASDSLGGHDGSTLGEQFLDTLLLEPGRVITCSAGNDNLSSGHTSGTVTGGATTDIVLTYTSYQYDDTIQIWYDGDDEFAVTLTVPAKPPTIIGPIAAGGPLQSIVVAGITITVESVLKHAYNNDNLIEVRIEGNGGNMVPDGDWHLQLYGTAVITGAFDAWVDSSFPPPGSPALHQWKLPVADTETVAVPATASRPISVGAHDGTAVPAILPFSGCGPSRDERIKPEIAAPGSNIVGASLRDMNLMSPGPLESPFPVSGTSYAAPIVAGAAALLFECRGMGLTCSDIKQILTDLAGPPAAAVPSNAFGFGFLQMATACAAPVPGVDVWLRDSATDTGIEPYTGGVAWLSPDIEILDAAGNPAANPSYDPVNPWNNLVDVTIRNRGTQTAANIEVYLYWADPATNLPFPTEWRTGGIYTGQPAFIQQSNMIEVGQLAAGANTTVRFAWAPPAPASNIRGDDHFCLIARAEHVADPSNVGAGGWAVIRGSNNIGLRNVHVQSASAGDVTTAFLVIGTDDGDALELSCEKVTGDVELLLPTRALPWRELALLERYEGHRPGYGYRDGTDPVEEVRRVLQREEVIRILGVTGAEEATVNGATTRLVSRGGAGRLMLSELQVQRGTKMPVRLWARRPQLKGAVGWVNVGQRSGGKWTGGISLELRAEVPEKRSYDVRLRGDQVDVTPRTHRSDIRSTR